MQVSPEVAFRTEDYESMVAEITSLLEAQGTLSAAQVRDHFNTSRRYVLALLEYLDSLGVTVREGDVRRLKK
jgi:selenocysteine-specific elongation factor